MSRKTISQKKFVETAEKAAEAGATPDQAIKQASEKVFGHEETRNLPAVIRAELGLDDDELRATFGRRIAKRFLDADDGSFPQYIEDVQDPAAKAKLKIEYLKTMKADLATAFITKQERHIVETDETRGRSDEEIEHRLRYGKWPEDMTLDGKDPGKPN